MASLAWHLKILLPVFLMQSNALAFAKRVKWLNASVLYEIMQKIGHMPLCFWASPLPQKENDRWWRWLPLPDTGRFTCVISSHVRLHLDFWGLGVYIKDRNWMARLLSHNPSQKAAVASWFLKGFLIEFLYWQKRPVRLRFRFASWACAVCFWYKLQMMAQSLYVHSLETSLSLNCKSLIPTAFAILLLVSFFAEFWEG